ncbi:unnamed protein product [Callosobruchus maculatus]|uniref:Uncharacterized protein n=1 Tax=Callosobruchus maculatus TaxID=64391 RepID=A0A653CBA5_CALMS|nr:unnamed protein product [Callosobruchus maculatus]VEN51328.1 unnamed protein product [Callosobruchus maculatus]
MFPYHNIIPNRVYVLSVRNNIYIVHKYFLKIIHVS